MAFFQQKGGWDGRLKLEFSRVNTILCQMQSSNKDIVLQGFHI